MKYVLHSLLLILVFQSFAFSENSQKIHISGTRLWINEIPNYQLLGTFPVLFEKNRKAEVVFTETSKSFAELWAFSRKPSQSAAGETQRDSIIDTTSFTCRAVVISHRYEGLIDPQGITTMTYVCGDSAESFSVSLAYADSSSGELRNELAAVMAGLEWRKNVDTDPLEQHDCTLKALNEYVPISRTTTEVVYTPYGLDLASEEPIPYFIVRSLFTRWTDLRPEEKKKYFEYILKNISSEIHILNVAEHGQINLDGVDGYQAVASGYDDDNDTTVYVCLTILFHPSGYFGLIGIAPEKDHEKELARFKEISRSFERIRFTGSADSACVRLLESKQFAKAEKCYSAALQKDPMSVPAALGKAAALMGLQKYQGAVSLYSGLIEDHDNLDSAYVGRAQAYMKLERYRDAIGDYDRAIDLNNESVLYYAGRGEAKEKYGNGQGAALDFEKASSMSPRTIDFYLAYARAMLSANENEKTLKMIERAIKIDSTNGAVHKLLGDVLAEEWKYPDALRHYNRAADLGVKTTEFYLKRSYVHLCLNDLNAAFSDADMACRTNKKSERAFYRRGLLYLSLGRLKEAVQDFNNSAKIGEEDASIGYYRGMAHFLLKNHKEAAADFKIACGSFFQAGGRALLYLAEREVYSDATASKRLMAYRNQVGSKQIVSLNLLAMRYALREITADEFIESMRKLTEVKTASWTDKVRNTQLGEAYFIIGMIDYSLGRKIGSKKSFEQCMSILRPEDEAYQISKLMIKETSQ